MWIGSNNRSTGPVWCCSKSATSTTAAAATIAHARDRTRLRSALRASTRRSHTHSRSPSHSPRASNRAPRVESPFSARLRLRLPARLAFALAFALASHFEPRAARRIAVQRSPSPRTRPRTCLVVRKFRLLPGKPKEKRPAQPTTTGASNLSSKIEKSSKKSQRRFKKVCRQN